MPYTSAENRLQKLKFQNKEACRINEKFLTNLTLEDLHVKGTTIIDEDLKVGGAIKVGNTDNVFNQSPGTLRYDNDKGLEIWDNARWTKVGQGVGSYINNTEANSEESIFYYNLTNNEYYGKQTEKYDMSNNRLYTVPTLQDETDNTTFNYTANVIDSQTKNGFKNVLMENNGYLFGQPPVVNNVIVKRFANRIDIQWENPTQYLSPLAGNDVDKVYGQLYLPIIKRIFISYYSLDGSHIRDTALIGGTDLSYSNLSTIDNLSITNMNYFNLIDNDINVNQTITKSTIPDVSKNETLTNAFVIFVGGDHSVNDREGNLLNFSRNFDIIKLDNSNNQVYYCNPSITYNSPHNIVAYDEQNSDGTTYVFQLWLENNTGNLRNIFTFKANTIYVFPPTALNIANPGDTNGVFIDLSKNISDNQYRIKFSIPYQAILGNGVYSTSYSHDNLEIKSLFDNNASDTEIVAKLNEEEIYFQSFTFFESHVNAYDNSNNFILYNAFTPDNYGIISDASWSEMTEVTLNNPSSNGNITDNSNNLSYIASGPTINTMETLSAHMDISSNLIYRFAIEAYNNISEDPSPISEYFYFRCGPPAAPQPPNIVFDTSVNNLQLKTVWDNSFTSINAYYENKEDSLGEIDTFLDMSHNTHNTLKIERYQIVVTKIDQINDISYVEIVDFSGNDTSLGLEQYMFDISLNDENKNYLYKAKIRCRNDLFGEVSGNDITGWSEYSVFSNDLSANPPDSIQTPTMKFYKNTTGNPDYIEYNWNKPNATGDPSGNLPIDNYQFIYFIGKGDVSDNSIYLNASRNVTNILDLSVNDKIIISTESTMNTYINDLSKNFMDISSYTYDISDNGINIQQHINSSKNINTIKIDLKNSNVETIETDISNTYGISNNLIVFKVNYTDVSKSPINYNNDAVSVYNRFYNAPIMTDGSFNLYVRCKNFINPNYSAFIPKIENIVHEPSGVELGGSYKSFIVKNDQIEIKFDEPVITDNSYNVNTQLFNARDAISILNYSLKTTIDQNVQPIDISTVDIHQENVEYTYLTTKNSNSLIDITTDTSANILFDISSVNVLETTYGTERSFGFNLAKPKTTTFDKAPLFMWNSDTNKVDLSFRRIESNLNVSSNILDISSDHYVNITNSDIDNQVDELKWDISSVLTYTINQQSLNYDSTIINTNISISDLSSNYINTDYTISNLTFTRDISYTFVYRTKNQFINNWLSPDNNNKCTIMIKVPSVPRDLSGTTTLIDNDSDNNTERQKKKSYYFNLD